MLAVSLLLAVVNGPRCKLARSYGVLSLSEANIDAQAITCANFP
jgi:hypothetical protein